MSKEKKSSVDCHNYVLEEVIDIAVVNKLYDSLKTLLKGATQVNVDAKSVKRLDTAAMQLILCWYRETKAKNIKVTWQNTEGVFYESAKTLGLNKELSLEN